MEFVTLQCGAGGGAHDWRGGGDDRAVGGRGNFRDRRRVVVVRRVDGDSDVVGYGQFAVGGR